ncbi:MAG: hypothetical protein EPO36_02720 [Chloroflexota bacterium]|nr:MAG: hypothetical protein EPO36_02720 [Chloroflexota bacterium]
MVQGENFPVGASVSVWVDGNQIDHGDLTVTSRDWGGPSIFEVTSPLDIVSGTFVRATIDGVERTTTVSGIRIENIEGNTISGVADGPDVTVVCNEVYRDLTVGPDLAWSVNMSQPPVAGMPVTTLGPGTRCSAWELDEDAAYGPSFTRVQRDIRDPRIAASTTDSFVTGWGFAPGVAVTITLDTVPVDDGSVTTDPDGNFWAGVDDGLLGDVEIGRGVGIEVVAGSDTRSVTTTNVAVTSIVGNVITGVGAPLTEVTVWVDDTEATATALPDANGDWAVDLSGVISLEPGHRGQAQQLDAEGGATWAAWRVANPAITVNPDGGWIEARDFAPGGTLSVTIDGAPIDGPIVTDEWGNAWIDVELELLPGIVVTVSDGASGKDVTISGIGVTSVAGNVITGTADGSLVHLWVNDSEVERQVAVVGGVWSVDVFVPGEEWEQETAQLGPGSSGGVQLVDDDGDATMADWGVPNPHFTVNMAWNGIEGWDWDGPVTVTIVDPVSEASRTFSGGDIQYPEGPGYFVLALDDVEPRWQLKPGHIVTVADATAPPKALTVAALTIDAWDFDADTMSGTSSLAGRITVDVDRPGAYGWAEQLTPGGSWAVDFLAGVEPFDLRVLDNAMVNLFDEDGDSTMIGPQPVAGPRFTVGLVNQEVVGCGWPDGALVTVTIQREGMVPFVRAVMSGPEIPETWMPLSGACNVYLDVAAGPLVMAGDVITMTDGTTTKTQVVPALEVNLADDVADELSGSTTMPEGSFLTVAAGWWWTGAPARDAVPEADGTWSVSFVDDEWGIQGSAGYAVQTDVDGDQAVVTAPAPDVLNDPMADRVWAIDFAAGPVDLTIERNGGVVLTRTTETRNVISGAWRYRDMWTQPVGSLARPAVALWDLAGVFDIQAGDVITVRDGVSERSIVVDDLTIDSVDVATGTVTGHAAGSVAFNLNEGGGWWGYGTNPTEDGAYSFVFDPAEFPFQGLEPGMTVIAIGQSWHTIVRWTIPIGFDFGGFLAPVDSRPTMNTVKAGRAVPVKFSLGGDFGLDIFADGYPASRRITSTGAQTDAVEITLAATNSGLSYDPVTGVYTYIWKTDKAWAGTCRQLVLRLADGSEYLADFKF